MKSFGDLFSDSLKEYSGKFTPILKLFLTLYVIPSILVAIIVGVIFLTSSFSLPMDQLQDDFTGFSAFAMLKGGISPIFIVLLVLVFIVYITASILLSISYIHLSLSKSKNISLSECLRVSKGLFWKYLGLCIVTLLALIGLFILLIIPGIIFMVFWIFASYALINEKLGIVDSLKKSKSIVKGRWWRTFGFLILLLLIVVAFSFVIGLLPFIGSLISSIIVQPFAVLFLKNFYLDMKKK
ncbi:MAG: hypothetical protein AABW50_01185 [Nanoarchaeota archaeon]